MTDKLLRAKNMIRLLAGAALAAGMSGPALALDDGQESIMGTFMSMVTLEGPKANEEASYRERPPLVLPPKMQLRPPQAGAAERHAAWPQDADIVRRQREAEASRLSSLNIFSRQDKTLTQEELRRGHVSGEAPNLNRDYCDTDPNKARCLAVKWEDLAGQRIVSPDSTVPVVVGQEPPRKALTDPPKGYRTPTKIVQEKALAPKKDDLGNYSFFLQKKPVDE